LLHVLFVLKIEDIFGKKNTAQKCWKMYFFLYLWKHWHSFYSFYYVKVWNYDRCFFLRNFD